jgi:dihydroneopterin aldolase
MDHYHDEIILQGIDLPVSIGVPDTERATLQVLKANVRVQPQLAFTQMDDAIERTIDYDALTQRLRALAAARPRHLIETLAAEMAEVIIAEFGAAWVSVELQKRILPGVDHVAVRTTRSLARM